MAVSEIRCTIEYRADETRQSPGHLFGVLVTYEKRARTRPEMFAKGALQWPDDGIILNRQHVRDAPIVRFVPEIVGDEVRIDMMLPDTTAGRDAATEVRNGTLSGLSVEFGALQESRRGGLRIIERAELRAAGLVDSADYGNLVEVRGSHRRRLWL